MIVEREQTMNEKELKNTKLFPQYILVRTPVDAEVVKVREAA
jgi:transcription antitermination factor NusG